VKVAQLVARSSTEGWDLRHNSRNQAAFQAYLRTGMPITWSLKQVRETERYVWMTRHDGNVRRSHARNVGQVFFWSDPPATGHPGEDYNCRCEATPYVEGETEYAYFEFSSGLASSYDRWTDRDFVYHYYFGEGRPVTLLEIGHLREIAEHEARSENYFKEPE
jgi:SPP1 gp7 family putative phage head morphogenesis protein